MWLTFALVFVRFFRVKISENHTSLDGNSSTPLYGRECRPREAPCSHSVDVNTIVMCIVDLGVTKESKMELGVMCNSAPVCVAVVCVRSYCPRNPLTQGNGFLLPFNLHVFMCQGSLELHVLSHVVLGPLSDVTHLTVFHICCDKYVLHSINTAPLYLIFYSARR